MAVSRKTQSIMITAIVGLVIYWVIANFVVKALPLPAMMRFRARSAPAGRLHDKDHELSTTAAVGSQGGGPYDAENNDRVHLQAAGAGRSTPVAMTSEDLPLHGHSVSYAIPSAADAFPAADAAATLRRLSSTSTAMPQAGPNFADNARRLDITSETMQRLDEVGAAGGDVLGALQGLIPDFDLGGDAAEADERVRMNKAGVRRSRGTFADSVGLRGHAEEAIAHFARPSDRNLATSSDRLRSAVGEKHSKLLDMGAEFQRKAMPVGQGEAKKASELLARLASMSMDPAVKAKLTQHLTKYMNSWDLKAGETLTEKHQRAMNLAAHETKPALGYIANRARLDKDGDLMPVFYPQQYSQTAMLQKDRVKSCPMQMNQYKHALVNTPQLA